MELVTQEWYQTLVDECKAIITEAIFTSRWALVEGYWNLGKRIREDNLAQEYSKGNKTFVQDLARNLSISERTIYYSLQAFDHFPDIGKMPEGKNLTWNKLITKYLPEPKENIIEISLPEGKYNIIYADPPWDYEFSETSVRSIGSHYPSLKLEEIKAIKIPSSDNSALFLWATAPKLKEALEVMEAWGFTYRTNAIWDKEIKGMGYWFRGQHELLLVGVKGEFSPPHPENRISSIYRERRGEHSKKPDYYYNLIESLFPQGKYLELFARKEREGWSSWGNQISTKT